MTNFRAALTKLGIIAGLLLGVLHWPICSAESLDPALQVPQSSTAIAPDDDFALSTGVGSEDGLGGQVPSPPSARCIFCLDYWRTLRDDVKYTFTSPTRWDEADWRSTGMKSLAVAAAMASLDRPVMRELAEKRTPETTRAAGAFEPFGRGEYAAAVVGGFWLAGKLGHKPKAQAVAVDALSATTIAAGLMTPALKLITGRSRPEAGRGVMDFEPFGGAVSFPSGHATVAFAVAGSIAAHYDRVWIKALAFGVPAGVAYARMAKDEHFFSDVTASALIGIGVARSVHEFNQGKRRATINIGSIRAPNGSAQGVQLSLAFSLR